MINVSLNGSQLRMMHDYVIPHPLYSAFKNTSNSSAIVEMAAQRCTSRIVKNWVGEFTAKILKLFSGS